MSMINKISMKFMKRSFEKTLYRFTEIPRVTLNGNFGIYVHVPFCLSKCSFCPFYKELFTAELKEQYMDAIIKEIDGAEIQGEAAWLYFGGGTPNLLTTEDTGRIVACLKRKVRIDNMGIELLPSLLSEEYLRELRTTGFSKISIGIESFSDDVIGKTGRKNTTNDNIGRFIKLARSLELWVNTDMMVGLPDQDESTFRRDIEMLAAMLPHQITIYPFMIIRGLQAAPCYPPDRQFALIEEAGKLLQSCGYSRKGVWTFAQGSDIYDSSRDELIADYIGFGPAAFSTYGSWKVVNPELDVYIRNMPSGKKKGFVATKSKASEEWRKFARMIYDLKLDDTYSVASYVNMYIQFLILTGYVKQKALTAKGTTFAHEITKAVVESLPFPVQNAGCIENYAEYVSYRQNTGTG